MYKQYLKVQDCKTGKGLFSSITIPAGVPILEITGPIVLDRDLKDNIENYLQVGPNIFLGNSGDIDDFINHHCDPNCRLHVMGNRAILYSLYVIPAEAELNIDYSTTSTYTLDQWQMNCLCGSNKCRKVISGHQYLDDELKQKYINNNMFPLYIIYPNLFQKR